MAQRELTAIVHKEGDWFVSLCPQLDIASQGLSADEARANLTEAIELFLECASPAEVENRLKNQLEVGTISIPWDA
jgi:predicted RNase H-like HicB family nuclease